MSRSSRGLGHRPFTAATGVRIPYGMPKPFFMNITKSAACAASACLRFLRGLGGLYTRFHHVRFLIQKLNNGHKNKIMTINDPAQAANAVSGTSAVSDDQVVLTPQCPACGRQENIVWVHGHGQCAHCHTNVMPCCDGAICEQPS